MQKKNKNNLTEKQQTFCDNLLTDPEQNQSKAYMAAYPNVKKETTASAAATRMLKDVNIKAYLAKRREELKKKAEIDQERVLKEESCIAFMDPAMIFELKNGTLLKPHELPEEIRRALSGIDVIENRSISGDVEFKYKYRFWDKGRSLERISKHLGMYEKDNAQKADKIVIYPDGRVNKGSGIKK